MPTLATSQFPPPASWEDLEILVWRLFKSIWNDPYTTRNGRSGQRQNGVDIVGRPGQGNKLDGIQVKGKHGFFEQSVTEKELRAEVEKAKGFIPALENFVLVTSARRDQQIQQTARLITEENSVAGRFAVTVLGWDDIEERLAQFPEVIREHYPQFEVKTSEFSSSQIAIAEQTSKAQLAQLQQALVDRAESFDLGLATNTVPILDDPPLKPAIYAPRQTTLEQIFSMQAAYSWVALIGYTGMGKTLLARAVWESKSQDQRRWISFRGHENSYESHLDRQLLGALFQMTGDDSLIERYRSGFLGGVEIGQHLSLAVPQGTLLVIDDVPDLSENEALVDRLASLAISWWNNGGEVLSTSQYEPPTRLLGILGTHLDKFIVPEMANKDIEELLELAGSPPELLKSETITSLGAITKRHPVLVSAAVQWLLKNDWRYDGEAFVSLLSGVALTEPMTEARAKVRSLVTSDAARDLLDRLSMITQAFDNDMVRALGNVTPAIERPLEQLSDLVGPWIQQSGDAGYVVSPLLQNAWQIHVPTTQRKEIHGAIAQQYMRSRTLSMEDAFQISVHLAGSEDWLGLASVLLRVMIAVEVPQHFEQIPWVLWFFRPGDRWPDEVPRQIRIAVRAQQVRGILLAQKSEIEYETDLESLLADPNPEDALAVFYARFATSILIDNLSPELTAIRAMQGARAFRMADQSVLQEFSIRPEEGFWGAVPKVKELTDIRAIIQVVRDMTIEERRVVFSPSLGTDMAVLLVDMCYGIEADKPTNLQDWNSVLDLIGEIHSAGQLEGAEVLAYASLRARATVLADFQGNTQGALSLLEVDFSGVDEVYRFLLTYTQACILLAHDVTEPAFAKFQEALSISVEEVFPHLQSDALGRGMIAASKADRFDISVIWGKRALQRGTAELGVGALEKIELLGELAWAHWSNGNRKKSCGAMYGAVTSLLRMNHADTERHREALAKIGHLTGWLSGVAFSGAAPKLTKDGQPYIDPYPGMVYSRAKEIPEFDSSTGLHYLPNQLAMISDNYICR